MQKYTQEQIDRANETELVPFLMGLGERFQKSGKEFRWMTHDSVTVNGNQWFRFSNHTGGGPVDFLMEFYGKSFPEAVEMLLGEEGENSPGTSVKWEEGSPIACPLPKPELKLPEGNEDSKRVREYLTGKRKLSEEIVDRMLADGKIYESRDYHNVVFIGHDKEGNIKNASVRGTDGNYRGEVSGSEKAFGFGHHGTDDNLFVFEAPIDLLSFLTAIPEKWEQHSYISLGGVGEKTMVQFLADHREIRKVYLCLDNDDAGNRACERLLDFIPEEIQVIRWKPQKKDWNECLMEGLHPAETGEQIGLRNREEPLVPVMKMSEVEERVVQWLWYPFIPFGKVTLIQGNPGKGKT